MNVGIVMNDFRQGGAERLVKDLVSSLAATGRVQPSLFVFDDAGNLRTEFETGGIDFTTLGFDVSTSSVPRAALGLAGTLEDAGIDLVHSHLPFSHLTSRLAAWRLDLPHVSTYHNVCDERSAVKTSVERGTRWLSDRIVCVSDGVRASYGDSPGMEVIYNAIDVEEFAGRVRDAPPAGLPEPAEKADLCLLNVARCAPVKRQADLLSALSMLDRTDTHLVVVGDGPLRPDLAATAEHLGVADLVTFTGYVDQVEPYYRAADVFVSSSVSEGLPTTHIEAMAAELPIISTEIPGVTEIVERGETGLLVPPESPEGLAEAIDSIDPGRVEGMGERGYEYARANFSLSTVADQHESLYTELAQV